jgi:hypothetical protein
VGVDGVDGPGDGDGGGGGGGDGSPPPGGMFGGGGPGGGGGVLMRSSVAGGLRPTVHRCDQSGMLPCLRRGSSSRLVRSIARLAATFWRVSAGSMTSSMYPRSAAAYGFA